MPRERRVTKTHVRTPQRARPPNVPDFLEVKTSTIPNAGNGLFAKRSLPKGTVLGEYIGERLSFEEAKGRDSSYMMYADERGPNGGQVIDGRTMENPMRWPNHDPANANARAELYGKRILFVTTKPVVKGREIKIDYGEDYGI